MLTQLRVDLIVLFRLKYITQMYFIGLLHQFTLLSECAIRISNLGIWVKLISLSPVQYFPVNPTSQEQKYEPSVLWQVALATQTETEALHSLISAIRVFIVLSVTV